MSKGAFVIPHWSCDLEQSKAHLSASLEGIFNQTDNDYQIIIVDDASPDQAVKAYLSALESKYPGVVRVVFNSANAGPGGSRNTGIAVAQSSGCPFILFNDADDISHPRRLEVTRAIFESDEQVSVVYSTFQVIDEFGRPVGNEQLTPSILEILESHWNDPIQGANAWIEMGISKGYTNLTSATSVRASVASRYPFPHVKVSEDFYAWMLYAADGGHYRYAESIPSLYRIPQQTGSATRARLDTYYEQKANVDESAFLKAIEVAVGRQGALPYAGTREQLLVRFYIKLAHTLARENELPLAQEQLAKANALSASETALVLSEQSHLRSYFPAYYV